MLMSLQNSCTHVHVIYFINIAIRLQTPLHKVRSSHFYVILEREHQSAAIKFKKSENEKRVGNAGGIFLFAQIYNRSEEMRRRRAATHL